MLVPHHVRDQRHGVRDSLERVRFGAVPGRVVTSRGDIMRHRRARRRRDTRSHMRINPAEDSRGQFTLRGRPYQLVINRHTIPFRA